MELSVFGSVFMELKAFKGDKTFAGHANMSINNFDGSIIEKTFRAVI